MHARIREALRLPVDYSEAFTTKVEGLADRIGEVLGVAPTHETDMNYRAGQLLTVSLDGDAHPLPAEQGGILMRIWVSSRGPVFTILPAVKEGNIVDLKVPSEIQRLVCGSEAADAVRRLLSEVGLTEVAEDLLSQPVPGHLTEMDGAPATVMEVLFCELC